MDEIIKLLQQLMARKPSPKGGIADTAAGIDFIGKKLSKEQIGDFTVIGSKLQMLVDSDPLMLETLVEIIDTCT